MEELSLSDVEKDKESIETVSDKGDEAAPDTGMAKEGEDGQETTEADEAEKSPADGIDVVVNEKIVHLRGKDSFIFVDVFDYIDFDLSKPQGKSVATLLNGKNAQYTEQLKTGDKLDIYWEP